MPKPYTNSRKKEQKHKNQLVLVKKPTDLCKV